MKKLLYLVLIVPFIISCNQKKIEQLQSSNDSLISMANLKDSSINDFLSAFNEIQDNLDTIKAKEMMITEKTEGKTELKKDAKDQINEDISMIYQLLIDTKDQLSKVKKNLGNSNYQIGQLEKMIDHLNNQLLEKDAEIEALYVELNNLNTKVVSLTKDVSVLRDQNQEKSTIINEQLQDLNQKTIEMNTAYFAIGSKKFLKDNNIITQEGGFIGIGSNKKLKADFNSDAFTKIDIRTTSVINIPGKKKVKVVTNHPEESYKITGEDQDRVFEIIDFEAFWNSTKYLVLITE
jgi:archaellum component FlaC